MTFTYYVTGIVLSARKHMSTTLSLAELMVFWKKQSNQIITHIITINSAKCPAGKSGVV